MRITLINLRGENKGAAELTQVMHRPKRVGVNGRCTTCLGEDEGFHNRKRQGTRMSKVLGSLPNKKQDSHCNAKTVSFQATCFVSKALPEMITLYSSDNMGRALGEKTSREAFEGCLPEGAHTAFLKGSEEQGWRWGAAPRPWTATSAHF